MSSLSLTESQTLSALRSFLLGILPSGVEVIRGQDNRVPEPAADDFVVMIPILRERLETNIDTYADVLFIGSIADTVLLVDSVDYGTLAVGRQVFGVGVAANTVIDALGNATGGVGTYILNTPQSVSQTYLAAGYSAFLQPTKVTVQLDVHGPGSADNVQRISTMLRDAYAADQFAASGYDVAPLFAGDPRQVPFLNAEEQIETRWTVDAVLQANPALTMAQQFADGLAVGLINVDVVYPPA